MNGPGPSVPTLASRRFESHCETQAMLPETFRLSGRLRPFQRGLFWLFRDWCNRLSRRLRLKEETEGWRNKVSIGTRISFSFLSSEAFLPGVQVGVPVVGLWYYSRFRREAGNAT